MSNLSNRPQNKNFGQRAGKAESLRKYKKNKQKYENNPKFCLFCNSKIPYDKRENKFCDRSCAAKWNNIHYPRRRGPLPRFIIENEISSPKKLSKRYKQMVCKVHFKQCIICNSWFRAIGVQKFCSETCKHMDEPRRYRRLCKFNLSPILHPELYNQKLIVKHGWYNPVNRPGRTNLTGVCWDHLFRIEDGFKQNVPPSIINHPANAELVPWPHNYARRKSLITLEQLYERIKLWDNGQRDLPTFYPSS